ncbi:MAG TPA: tetratricopeptide repeat protein [Candidatus Omnitrophota bacterium]|mgnify:CR=1 FL=1|nr:tetratricopeptide repeat protein [Candidatus Omnitrophota bacterium]HPS19688.1 tetratricopeptide repeat protein [Candidatus Omnitrophota bacterium]
MTKNRGKRSKTIKSPSPFLLMFLIVAAAFLVYLNSLHSPFVFDDKIYITQNKSIRDLFDLAAMWKANRTRFVAYFSFALNYRFSGLEVFWYHLTNIAVHAGASLFVWRMAYLIGKEENEVGNKETWVVPFFAGILFAVHPVQTQAVTYICQRITSLATFFYLAAFVLYLEGRISSRGGGKIRYVFFCGACCFCIFAMFTKEISVTLPVMIICYEIIFNKGQKFREKIKYVVPAAAAILIIPLAIGLFGDTKLGQILNVFQRSNSYLVSTYFFTQLKVICTYIRLAFVPFGQNLDYDYLVSDSFFEPSVIASAVVLCSIIFTAFIMRKNNKKLFFCVSWFFITVLPQSSFFVSEDLIFEHRLYLPLAGFAVFLPEAVSIITGRKNKQLLMVILVIISVIYGGMTIARNAVWRDGISLWTDVIKKSPNKVRGYHNRGVLYYESGETDKALMDYDKAIGILFRIKAEKAAYYELMQKTGVWTEEFIVEIKLDNAKIFCDRGIVYTVRGEKDKAISDFDSAIEINPKYALAYKNRAVAYFLKGEYDKSRQDVKKAQELGAVMAPDFMRELNRRSGAR